MTVQTGPRRSCRPRQAVAAVIWHHRLRRNPCPTVIMPTSFDGKLVVAISSRALFDLEESNRVFEEQGVEAYYAYQREHEDEGARARHRLSAGEQAARAQRAPPVPPRVEVILLSRNTADTGLRIMTSIEHYQLDISRAAFTGGESTYPYVPAFDAHLFLSANPVDVRKALDAGHAAATILPSNVGQNSALTERAAHRLRRRRGAVFRRSRAGLQARTGWTLSPRARSSAAREPLSGGPFKNFLAALHRIQSEYPPERSPIRTALVTARSAPGARARGAHAARLEHPHRRGAVPRRAGQGAVPEGLRRRHFLRRSARPLRIGTPARGHRACAVRRRQRVERQARDINSGPSRPRLSPGTGATAATIFPGRARATPTAIWVSEIMLQQTQVGDGDSLLRALSRALSRRRSARRGAAGRGAAAVGGPGLLLARAQPARAAAHGRRSSTAARFRARARRSQRLPGIGRSTAAAIAAFAFGAREAILDGNVKRVLCAPFRDARLPGRHARWSDSCGNWPSRCCPHAGYRSLYAGAHGSRRDGLHARASPACAALSACVELRRACTRARGGLSGAAAAQGRRPCAPTAHAGARARRQSAAREASARSGSGAGYGRFRNCRSTATSGHIARRSLAAKSICRSRSNRCATVSPISRSTSGPTDVRFDGSCRGPSSLGVLGTPWNGQRMPRCRYP